MKIEATINVDVYTHRRGDSIRANIRIPGVSYDRFNFGCDDGNIEKLLQGIATTLELYIRKQKIATNNERM